MLYVVSNNSLKNGSDGNVYITLSEGEICVTQYRNDELRVFLFVELKKNEKIYTDSFEISVEKKGGNYVILNVPNGSYGLLKIGKKVFEVRHDVEAFEMFTLNVTNETKWIKL